jgi:hypothetical protein
MPSRLIGYDSAFLHYTGHTVLTSDPMSWIVNEIPIPKPEKELTEKQLFSKLKKELKEVVNRTSAI